MCAGSLFIASTTFAYTPTPTFGNTPTHTPTSNRPIPVPVVEVAPNPAASGETVILDASASTGAILSYQWSGPAEILIENASSPVASFVAPEVNERTVIVIELQLTSYGSTPGNFARLEVEILPRDTVELALDHVYDVPGATIPVGVTLRSVGQQVVAVGNEIEFERFAFIRATEGGTPDCSADEKLAVETASFQFLPDGCTPEVDCAAVAAHVTTSAPIPDRAVVYRCQVFLSSEPIDPTDTCRHELPCSGTGATSASQEPLAVVCLDGSARADSGEYDVSFEISVEPPTPRVGDLVRIRITAGGVGGQPAYQLFGTQPFLEGDVSLITLPVDTVEYELRAVCPGTATLRTSVTYEVNSGCPGSEVAHHRTGDGESFEIEILPAPTYSITGSVAEFPSGCFGAQRGYTVTLEPLGLTTQTDLSVGGFVFENVPAGEYTLTVGPSCNPFGCWPPTLVTVTDSAVDGVRICPIDATPTSTPTPTPTPTPIPECPGDCDQDGVVGIDEVVAAIESAVEDVPPSCGTDVNSDGRVDINELVRIVRAALTACSGGS